MTAGIKANADGSAAIQVGGSDAITITSALNTTFAGTANVATGALYPIVSGTAVTASGTSVNFTGIPSWVKRITVMFSGVSTNGTSNVQVQLGTGATPTYTTTGYVCYANYAGGTNQAGGASYTSGFVLDGGLTGSAAIIRYGILVLDNLTGNTWVPAFQGNTSTTFGVSCSGVLALGAALTAVRVTTVGGTDTFDAGSINILYE